LYVIPEIATPEQTVVLVQGEGRKQRFVAPLPKPLVVTGKSSAVDPKADRVKLEATNCQ
jgi:hypothetical protein